MSPTPEPIPGYYLDSCQTRYRATHDKRSGWWLQKMSGEKGRPPAAFQYADFAAACNAKTFTFQPDTI